RGPGPHARVVEADVLVSGGVGQIGHGGVAQMGQSDGGRTLDHTPDMERYLERISDRDLTVGVIGLGYVGLPLVIGFAEAGYRTIGFDVDAERIADLNAGRSHI